MGQVVTLGDIRMSEVAEGVLEGPITAGDLSQFTAARVVVAPGARWSVTGAQGRDTYLFVLSGSGEIASDGVRHAFRTQTFATIGEAVSVEVGAAGGAPLEVLRVETTLRARGDIPGFGGALEVAERSACPVVPVAAEHKLRIYFCGHHGGAYTERGHAMIVVYDGETHTVLHHHPDAESLFVLLDGACEFTVEGRQHVVSPGQAAYFGMHDRHGLKTAMGHAGASFLEFHIPAKFTTVKT